VVYSVIKEHQGSIKVESEVNKGSVFTLRLPIAKMTNDE
jgi:signal transduction histidine kinase